MLSKAIRLASQAHEGQFRKLSGLPYITHPLAVMGTLIDYGYTDEHMLVLAVLHDVMEDSDGYETQIWVKFGVNIYADLKNLIKESSLAITNVVLCDANYHTQLVKVADIKHNTREKISNSYIDNKLDQMEYLEKVRNTQLWKDTWQQLRVHQGML